MMDSPKSGTEEGMKLGRASAAFALSAAVTVLFSTALAWAKDAYPPPTNLMNALTGNNWTTHGLTDAVLFIGLGLIFSRTSLADRISPNRLISFLVGAVVVASFGLLGWFAWF